MHVVDEILLRLNELRSLFSPDFFTSQQRHSSLHSTVVFELRTTA